MNPCSALRPAAVDRPIFVLGERVAAVQLVDALGETRTLCGLPRTRLLSDLVSAVDRCGRVLESPEGLRPAGWYREVQAAQLRASGKLRTVEFSGLSILRLLTLFPQAQFVVVRQLKRAMPRSRPVPTFAASRVLEVDSGHPASPETLEHVLVFLGEPAGPIELDLSDQPQLAADARSGGVNRAQSP